MRSISFRLAMVKPCRGADAAGMRGQDTSARSVDMRGYPSRLMPLEPVCPRWNGVRSAIRNSDGMTPLRRMPHVEPWIRLGRDFGIENHSEQDRISIADTVVACARQRPPPRRGTDGHAMPLPEPDAQGSSAQGPLFGSAGMQAPGNPRRRASPTVQVVSSQTDRLIPRPDENPRRYPGRSHRLPIPAHTRASPARRR